MGEWFQYGNIESPGTEGDFQLQLLQHGPQLNRIAPFEDQRCPVDQINGL